MVNRDFGSLINQITNTNYYKHLGKCLPDNRLVECSDNEADEIYHTKNNEIDGLPKFLIDCIDKKQVILDSATQWYINQRSETTKQPLKHKRLKLKLPIRDVKKKKYSRVMETATRISPEFQDLLNHHHDKIGAKEPLYFLPQRYLDQKPSPDCTFYSPYDPNKKFIYLHSHIATAAPYELNCNHFEKYTFKFESDAKYKMMNNYNSEAIEEQSSSSSLLSENNKNREYVLQETGIKIKSPFDVKEKNNYKNRKKYRDDLQDSKKIERNSKREFKVKFKDGFEDKSGSEATERKSRKKSRSKINDESKAKRKREAQENDKSKIDDELKEKNEDKSEQAKDPEPGTVAKPKDTIEDEKPQKEYHSTTPRAHSSHFSKWDHTRHKEKTPSKSETESDSGMENPIHVFQSCRTKKIMEESIRRKHFENSDFYQTLLMVNVDYEREKRKLRNVNEQSDNTGNLFYDSVNTKDNERKVKRRKLESASDERARREKHKKKKSRSWKLFVKKSKQPPTKIASSSTSASSFVGKSDKPHEQFPKKKRKRPSTLYIRKSIMPNTDNDADESEVEESTPYKTVFIRKSQLLEEQSKEMKQNKSEKLLPEKDSTNTTSEKKKEEQAQSKTDINSKNRRISNSKPKKNSKPRRNQIPVNERHRKLMALRAATERKRERQSRKCKSKRKISFRNNYEYRDETDSCEDELNKYKKKKMGFLIVESAAHKYKKKTLDTKNCQYDFNNWHNWTTDQDLPESIICSKNGPKSSIRMRDQQRKPSKETKKSKDKRFPQPKKPVHYQMNDYCYAADSVRVKRCIPCSERIRIKMEKSDRRERREGKERYFNSNACKSVSLLGSSEGRHHSKKQRREEPHDFVFDRKKAK